MVRPTSSVKWKAPLDEINEIKATKVINKVKILLPEVVVFAFTKFQRHLSTFTSSDLRV